MCEAAQSGSCVLEADLPDACYAYTDELQELCWTLEPLVGALGIELNAQCGRRLPSHFCKRLINARTRQTNLIDN